MLSLPLTWFSNLDSELFGSFYMFLYYILYRLIYKPFGWEKVPPSFFSKKRSKKVGDSLRRKNRTTISQILIARPKENF